MKTPPERSRDAPALRRGDLLSNAVIATNRVYRGLKPGACRDVSPFLQESVKLTLRHAPLVIGPQPAQVASPQPPEHFSLAYLKMLGDLPKCQRSCPWSPPGTRCWRCAIGAGFRGSHDGLHPLEGFTSEAPVPMIYGF